MALTNGQIVAIRANRFKQTPAQLAERYGVTARDITNLWRKDYGQKREGRSKAEKT